MRDVVAELGCMDGSPWVQKTNVILLEGASCDGVEDLFSSSEVSLMVLWRSVYNAAERCDLWHVTKDHDSDL